MANLLLVSDQNDEVSSHVIFIHGLGGDPIRTWLCLADSKLCWPKWLAEDIEDLSVWTVGYDVSISRWGGSAMPLTERAENILERILVEPMLAGGDITLIGHSFGGLVIKQLLRNADTKGNQQKKYSEFIDRVCQVGFLSTPHSGSDHASLIDKLRLFIQPSAATACLVRCMSSNQFGQMVA